MGSGEERGEGVIMRDAGKRGHGGRRSKAVPKEGRGDCGRVGGGGWVVGRGKKIKERGRVRGRVERVEGREV